MEEIEHCITVTEFELMELCFIHQHHQFRWEEIIGHYRACSLETKPVSPDRLPLPLPRNESVNVNFF